MDTEASARARSAAPRWPSARSVPGSSTSCPEGHGVFLARIDLGSLVESETDWHRLASQGTMPIPRITADMEKPRTSKVHARAWVETLFS